VDDLKGYRFQYVEPASVRAYRRKAVTRRKYVERLSSRAYWVMICPDARGRPGAGKRVRLDPEVTPSDVVRLVVAFGGDQ